MVSIIYRLLVNDQKTIIVDMIIEDDAYLIPDHDTRLFMVSFQIYSSYITLSANNSLNPLYKYQF